MRKTIDTAPRNGDFVILEDGARGTIAVARWSTEAAQWLDEHGTPSQLNATHWHPPQNRDEEGTPSQLNASYWQSLTPARSVVKTVDQLGLLTAPSKPSAWHIRSEASRPASGGATTQPQRTATPARSVNVWVRFVGFAGRGRGKILSACAGASGWIVHRTRGIATMAACLLVGAAFAPFLHGNDPGKWLLYRPASENDTRLKQALRQEQERANKLASDVTEARRVAESQALLIRQAGDAAGREKEASERALVGLRQALQLELAKAEKLGGQLAEAQRNNGAQAALTRKTIDDAARAEAERERVIGELRRALKQQDDQTAQIRREVEGRTAQAKQANVRMAEQLALKQEQDKAEKLGVELATARREGEAQAAILRSARDEATRIKEASARATDELRQALQQAQDKAEKLAGELAMTRQEVEAQTAAAQSANDEARRAADRGKRSVEEQSRALRETQGKAEKLASELAAARQEVQSQQFAASLAKDQAVGVKEAAERSVGDQRRALQQERNKTEKLTAELDEARSNLEAQTKAKATEEAARDDQLAALRQELQTARAEATVARELLEAERTRTQRVEQQLTSIQESTGPRASRSPAAASTVGQPLITASSVPVAPTKAPTEDVQQPTNVATPPSTYLEQGSPHTVRLIARANILLEQGNIGAARNMLDRAAEMGSTEALFWLAETYDPLLLSARQTIGTQSDIAKARELYGKALARGVSQAKDRLEALQQ
jgi:hypothetical protein